MDHVILAHPLCAHRRQRAGVRGMSRALTTATATAKTPAPKGHGALPLVAGSGYLALGDSVTR